MTAFLTIDNVSRLFGPNLSLGEKIAARLGGMLKQDRCALSRTSR